LKGLKKIFAMTVVIVMIVSVLAITASAAPAITSYGVVKASLLNIRTEASTSGQVVGQVPNGEIVGVHWTVPGWSYVTYNGVTGYVSAEYIQYTQASRSGQPVAVSNKQAIVKLSSSTLNLRASASTSAAVLAQIPNNTKLSVSEVSSDWAKVTYNGTVGYVAIKYLDFSKQAIDSAAATPAAIPAQTPSRSGAVSTQGQAVVELAKQHLGKAYVYGATGPNNFDCSGLVYYVYRQMGVTLNRVAHDQMKNGTYVPKDQLQPGDIVGFSRGNGYIHHVGIYVGNGMMIHAPQTGDVVKYESIVTGGYANRLVGGRRIF